MSYSISSDLPRTPGLEPSFNKTGAEGDKESPYGDQLPELRKQDRHDQHVQTIPWRYKLPAGAMILLFAFGSSLSETTLGPLKSTLIKELKITSKCRMLSGSVELTARRPIRYDSQCIKLGQHRSAYCGWDLHGSCKYSPTIVSSLLTADSGEQLMLLSYQVPS